MIKASFEPYTLEFKQPSGTSRGILKVKKIWIVSVWDEVNSTIIGTGECNPLVGLSIDDVPEYEEKLKAVCQSFSEYEENLYQKLIDFPSIYFGFEMALLDLKRGGNKVYFNTPFVKLKQPIKINGLIWMGEHEFMHQQIQNKIEQGFSCIKLKIGAINFQEELQLLASIREKYSEEELELRVDANGAFKPSEALEKLKVLDQFDIHSIEQPIMAGQLEDMAYLCDKTYLPIALDEELIGVKTIENKRTLLERIMPQYIILKPSLIGGFKGSMEWIEVAGELGIPWWITSALESNIGLNAIAQFTSTFYSPLPQGLGTGQLYSNNIESPLKVKGEWLSYEN
jgi:o-succinylbenzoate synthase